ncbi:MAG TPA: molybdopterin-dependent oxidoreductase [Segeticoccus sp.]|uniref:molybdopterin-dependent oxidoreductase n=1 Tax=Segeticoccus sp. TaxID=2706531 RepID=UPI002D7E49B2|nr:molybdopterin-dependent oxidoreductase [Segeticoccus sp.]HET8601424.1 molybdopterin-dependent oxidoreductase [Segeticoccus sp.]
MGFPLWVIVTHFLNIFLMLLLARSGLEVLSAFPKLYRTDDCPPGHEWLRLTGTVFTADSRRRWSSLQEEDAWPSLVALPGHKNLGLGRHWHFMSVQFWILNGLVYLGFVFASGYWHYLLPTSWSIFPEAIRDVGTYLHFRLAPELPGQPFNAAQKLAYFFVIFILAPTQILTGAAMSPAVIARFPWFTRLFGGKQGARSLHFLGLVAFALFVLVHTVMVIIHGVPTEFAAMVLGSYGANHTLGLAIGLLGIALLLAFHVVITWFSLRYRRATQHLLGFCVNPFERAISRAFRSRQHLGEQDVSPYFRVNGFPPPDESYAEMARHRFAGYRLAVAGLVERPTSLSLADLRALGVQEQVTKHNCIQGWTAVARWGGVPVATLIERVRPTPEARWAVFYAMDDKGLTEGEGRYGYFYEVLPIELLAHPQSILALDMNGAPLPVEHGAPVRLRVETQLGFKMVKWVTAIEFVADFHDIGMGQGGWREDQQFYAASAGI